MKDVFQNNQFENYLVRVAGINDVAAVTDMLKSAALLLKTKGISQWGYLLSGGEDEEIKQDILAGTTYIVEDGKTQVATFNFSPKQNSWDIDMWGKRTDSAFYIHRLAVHKEHHNKKIGKKILKWIDGNLQLKNGFVRLDCIANNPVLNDFYHQAGYRFAGHVGEGDDKFTTYEKAF